MGRAIVRHPHVFLFDEPLSNLDAKLRVQMRVEIKALQQRLATTSIYVTHDQMEAMTMSDRIVILNEGRVEQIGAPLDLYDRPANLFVAGFIGSPAMNILNGRLKRADGGAFVEVGGLRLPVAADAAIAEGRAVSWGLRPEHCRLGDGPGACPSSSISSRRRVPIPTFTARSPARRSSPWCRAVSRPASAMCCPWWRPTARRTCSTARPAGGSDAPTQASTRVK